MAGVSLSGCRTRRFGGRGYLTVKDRPLGCEATSGARKPSGGRSKPKQGFPSPVARNGPRPIPGGKGHRWLYQPENACSRQNGMLLAHVKAWSDANGGKCPPRGFVVHHEREVKNGGNDSPGNLRLLSRAEHNRAHKAGMNTRKRATCEARGGRLIGRRQRCSVD